MLYPGSGAGEAELARRRRVKPWPALSLFVLLLPGAFAAESEPSAAVDLSEPLAQWKKEIEAIGWGKVIPVRVCTDRERNQVVLPRDAGQRPILRRYFQNENFLREFIATHAMNINYKGIEGRFHFILLNMARAADWGDYEDAVLAHEFGHVWLYAQNYPFPAYEGRADSCAGILAGDAVQHILIREEIRRRQIPYLPYWIGNLERALVVLEGDEGNTLEDVPVCRLLAELVQWLDVRMGLSPETWDKYDRFLAAMERRYAELKPRVDELYEVLHEANVHDQDVHLRVLREVLVRMYALADSLAAAGRPAQ